MALTAPFWINAISNLGVIAVLFTWSPDSAATSALPAERFGGTIRIGLRHALQFGFAISEWLPPDAKLRNAQHQPIGPQSVDRSAMKRRVGRLLETDRNFGIAFRHVLARADVERHAGPAPIVDLKPHRNVGLNIHAPRKFRRVADRGVGQAHPPPSSDFF
jgi:hypothetical protein